MAKPMKRQYLNSITLHNDGQVKLLLLDIQPALEHNPIMPLMRTSYLKFSNSYLEVSLIRKKHLL
jgi:hypothetical protein